MGDGSAPVLTLCALAEALSRLSAGVTQIAVIEGKDTEPRSCKPLGIGQQAIVAGQREAVCHHHA